MNELNLIVTLGDLGLLCILAAALAMTAHFVRRALSIPSGARDAGQASTAAERKYVEKLREWLK